MSKEKLAKLGKLQAGFVPFIIIAIVAVLAVGGGAYVVSKNKANAPEDNVDTQANANADANANANANLGANAKGSLRSLIGMGKNVMCTFESKAGDVDSSGTVYIAANGNMRGDFKMGAESSSMMMKDGVSYVWSGNKGFKMTVPAEAEANAGAKAEVSESVDLDAEVDYSCSDWKMDASKFTLPTGVEFVDLEAMLKAGAGAGADLKGVIKYGQ